MKRVTLSLLLGSLLLAQSPKDAFFQERKQLQERAKAAFDREMAREKAGDCRDAKYTRELNQCFGGEVETSTANYQAYSGALRAMLQQKNPFDSGSTGEFRGPTGRVHTQQEIINEFDQAQLTWEKYRDAFCSGADGLYRGGTAVNIMVGACQLMVLRSHMRELAAVYGEYLSHESD